MLRVLGMCFNWKVLVGLGAFAVAVLVLAPAATLAVLPLLLLAACPLSMAWMMFRMQGHGSQGDSCHSTASEQSADAKRARLGAIREEEQRLEIELAASEADSSATASTPHPISNPAASS